MRQRHDSRWFRERSQIRWEMRDAGAYLRFYDLPVVPKTIAETLQITQYGVHRRLQKDPMIREIVGISCGRRLGVLARFKKARRKRGIMQHSQYL